MELIKLLEKFGSLEEYLSEDVAELIGIAKQLAEVLPKLKGKIAGADDPWSIYQAVRRGISEQAILDAFTAADAGAEYTKLKNFADKFDGKLPKETEILLRKVGFFEETSTGTDKAREKWSVGKDPGLISWDKTGKLVSASLPDGEISGSVGLNGKIAAACEVGSLWFYGNDKVTTKGLIRIGLAGELGVTASGKVPFGTLGSVGAEASAGVAAQVHLFWRRPEEQLVLEALPDILKRPVNIYSLADMFEACHGSADPVGLEGLIMAIDGHASLDIDLAVAREFDVEGFFSATAGLTVNIDLARKAAYELSVRKVPEGLRLVLSHGDSDSRGWGVGIGIDIDASQVARRVGAVLKDAVEHWDSVLEEIKPYLSPGTWLQEEAGLQLDRLLGKLASELDEDIIVALKNDLRLLLGHDGEEQGLAQLLADKVLDAVSSLEGTVSGKAKDLSKKAVAEVALRLPVVAQESVKTKLEEEIQSLIEQYQGELEDLTKELVQNQIDKVEKALKKLGKNVSTAGAKANAYAKELRAMVDEADKLVHKIAAAVEDEAIAKISARLRFEHKRVEQEQYEVAGTFSNASEEASALYNALMMGRLSGIDRVFDPTQPDIAGFEPDLEKCSVRRFSKVSKSLGYEVVLLGMNLTGRGEVSGSADVQINGKGDLSVTTISIAKRSAIGLMGTSRSTDFVGTGSILLAKAEGDARPAELRTSFVLDLSASRKDTDLTVGEVKNFLALMTETELIGAMRSAAAVQYLQDVTGSRGGGKLPGAVTVEMTLSAAESIALSAFGRDSEGEKARVVFDTALDALFETGEWERDDFEWFVNELVKEKNLYDADAEDPFREKYFANRFNVKRTSSRHGPRSSRDPKQAKRVNSLLRHEAVLGLANLVVGMAEIEAATPSRAREGNAPEWGLDEYRHAGIRIAKAAKEWIGTNQRFIFFFGKDMDRKTVALMLSLARLSLDLDEDEVDGTCDKLFSIALVIEGVEAKAF